MAKQTKAQKIVVEGKQLLQTVLAQAQGIKATLKAGSGHKINITHESSEYQLSMPINSVVVAAAAGAGNAISKQAEAALNGIRNFTGKFHVEVVAAKRSAKK